MRSFMRVDMVTSKSSILLAESNYDDSALKSACGHAKEHGST